MRELKYNNFSGININENMKSYKNGNKINNFLKDNLKGGNFPFNNEDKQCIFYYLI